MNKRFKYYHQLDERDCGPTCIRMIAAHYGKDFSIEYLRSHSYITRTGVSLSGLSSVAERIGFKTIKAKLSYKQLVEEVQLPCILHWNQEHYVVLFEIKKVRKWTNYKLSYEEIIVIGDPGHDLVHIDKDTLFKCWANNQEEKGISLLLEPSTSFYEKEIKSDTPKSSFSFLTRYLRPYRQYINQVLIGMAVSSLISLVFPFLTQSIVDFGIQQKNLNFINLILFSQLLLFIGNSVIEIVRNWILLHISTRVSVSVISDFLMKLMRLPISFFESKNIGDITQRIQDHHRIETFLTNTALSTFFSIFNLIVFSVVLGIYNLYLLLLFDIGSFISIGWIIIFLRKRKHIDYKRFQRMRENQNTIYELIAGMQEIKLNNCERPRRWQWERIQVKLFKINIKGLIIDQYQEVGFSFITQLKNIFISFFAATLVIENQITLGAMLSISYIIGQMNNPLSQLILFIRSTQDAKLSLERLSEIHNKTDEEVDEDTLLRNNFNLNTFDSKFGSTDIIKYFNNNLTDGITLENVSFRYGSPNSPLVLKDININIPHGKVTAIVGTSGSGKTTLLKLLLKFHAPTTGKISINSSNLLNMSANEWRMKCGTVMQDGFIFSDTIANNIAINGDDIDEHKLSRSIQIANLQDYINRIPLGLSSKIGNAGSGLSGGQRQRIFIARAIYKDPVYLFFDEATSALDANNEKVIMNNLNQFFEGRTVVIIAHRLSTVKNADQIILLENGEVKEVGNHAQLTSYRGSYFELVKNQLELSD